MGIVTILLDPYRVSDSAALEIGDVRDVPEIRRRMHRCLSAGAMESLVVRMDYELFERFKDFEGLQNVCIRRLSPRGQLSKVLGETALPGWLTDKLIADAAFLEGKALPSELRNGECLAGKLLGLVNVELLHATTLSSLLGALQSGPAGLGDLLRIPEVHDRFVLSLKEVTGETCAPAIAELLVQGDDLKVQVSALAQDRLLEVLRSTTTENLLQIGVPPRQFSPSVLNCIPTRGLAEIKSVEFGARFAEVLKALAQRVAIGQAPATSLANLFVAPWPELLRELSRILEQSKAVCSKELSASLQGLGDEVASQLAAVVEAYADAPEPSALRETADTREASEWLGQYLPYARQQFLRLNEPIESLGTSFSDWLIANINRVSRSNWGWRVVAEAVQKALRSGNAVILATVDALGALDMDLMVDALRDEFAAEEINSRVVFSPIPTITEIGKLSVTTGLAPGQIQNRSQEEAIRAAYGHLVGPEGLVFVKSWTEDPVAIGRSARLIVYFENRIDERLHDATSFDAHRRDVKLICAQVAERLRLWTSTIRDEGQSVDIILTADHGMTIIGGKGHENASDALPIQKRATKVSGNISPAPFGLTAVQPEGYSEQVWYWVVRGRARIIGDGLLTHGGLLPEEVAIPFIAVRQRAQRSLFDLLKVAVIQRVRTLANGWSVPIEIQAGLSTLSNVRISAEAPFAGATATLELLSAGARRTEWLLLTSTHHQVGVVSVGLSVRFMLAGEEGVQEIRVPVNIELPQHLRMRSEQAQAFEDMFGAD